MSKPAVWRHFVDATKGTPPKQLLVKAVPFCESKKEALDLGAGALSDSIYLLSQGFQFVSALDQENHVQDLIDLLPADRFRFIKSSFEEYAFPSKQFDLVNAQYALPFMSPAEFGAVFERILQSIKDRGIFVGQLFGIHDSWNSPGSEMSFHRLQEVKDLLAAHTILLLEEKEFEGTTVSDEQKHWHVFHLIVRVSH